VITLSTAGFGPAIVDELARRVAGRRVIVVGDAMVDDDVIGTVDRLSPEAPAPVLRATSVRSGLGGAANAAAGLRALGADVALLAVVGDDHHGATLRDLALADGIDCSQLLTRADRRTTVKQRLVDRGRQLARIDYEDRDPIDSATVRQLLDGVDRGGASARRSD
jgi:rfaE bifunctional protein kinase chain/domain